MDIERRDGTKERRTYGSIEEMMRDAKREAKNPETKTMILHFPKMVIPSKKQRR